MAERASRIVLVLRLKDSLFAPSSPFRFRGESQIRSLDYCLRTHNPCPIQAFSTSLPDFLSHFYFRKRFIFLSTFSLFPFFFFFPPNSFHDRSLTKTLHENSVIQVRSTLATDTAVSLSSSSHTFLRPYLSLSMDRGEERPTKAEKIPQRRLQFNLFAVHASLLALNHERQFRSAGGTNFCKQVCLPDPRAPSRARRDAPRQIEFSAKTKVDAKV